jgi:hypothetical protein
MSPLVWDLAYVGQQEELRAGGPARPGMLPPAVDALHDAFKHPRAERAGFQTPRFWTDLDGDFGLTLAELAGPQDGRFRRVLPRFGDSP